MFILYNIQCFIVWAWKAACHITSRRQIETVWEKVAQENI